MYQPELGTESVDLHTGVVMGKEVVPDGTIGKRMEGTLMRGPQWVCQNCISDGQKDRRNRGGFLYSERRSTTGGGQ